MENLSIRPASASDLKEINALAKKIWLAHYPSIISMEQIYYMLDMMYSEEALLKQLEEGHQFHLLKENENAMGYLSYSRSDEQNYFLHKIYLDNTIQKKGAGSWFMNEVFNKIKDIHALRLTVNRKNYTAINFYFKNGFIIEKVADFDIGNNFVMNDFVMVKKYSGKTEK